MLTVAYYVEEVGVLYANLVYADYVLEKELIMVSCPVLLKPVGNKYV